jgi:hypothetical protein
MIFKDRVALYQPDETFEYGEFVRDNFTYQGLIICHLKFDADERLIAQRKQELKEAVMLYEWTEYALSFRDIVEYDGIYYRLLTDPVPITGMSRTFYRTKLLEDPGVVV